MYQITVIMTCNGKDCEKQITIKSTDFNFNDGIAEIKERFEKQGINIGVSLCPKCVEKSKSRLKSEWQYDRYNL